MFNDAKHFMKEACLQADLAIAKAKSKFSFVKTGVVAGVASAGSSAFAVGPDLSTLTAAIDFGTVTTAVLGAAAALIVVYIAWKGAKMVISAVRGG